MPESKLSLYSQLARPFTLLPPLLGIVSGAVCAFGSVHNPDPSRSLTLSVVLTVILGSLCASFMNAASNAINQIYDLEIDRLNKPNRPLVTGALSIREAWIFTWIFYALALILMMILRPQGLLGIHELWETHAVRGLLRRFRPEYVGPEPPGINATVTLTPKGGLPFRIRELS